MKIKRIDIKNWNNLLSTIYAKIADAEAPAPLLKYLKDRLIDGPESKWQAYENGWTNSEFNEWDNRASNYVKNLSLDLKSEIAIPALVATSRIEMQVQTPGSNLIGSIENIFEPLGKDHSMFGLLSAQNDAVGEFLHAMVCFDKQLLRGRLELTVDQIRTLIQATTETARFRTKNRLSAEYYPFAAALQQIKKQSTETLRVLNKDLSCLHQSIHDLPFDDADSRRKWRSQVKLAAEIVDQATS